MKTKDIAIAWWWDGESGLWSDADGGKDGGKEGGSRDGGERRHLV